METNIPSQDFCNDYSFEKFNEIASKNIKRLKEDEDLLTYMPYIFPKAIQKQYPTFNRIP